MLDVLFSESDHLFLSEIETDNVLTNDVDAIKHVWAIKKLRHKIDQLKELEKQMKEFYKTKREQVEQAIGFLEPKLVNYLDSRGDNLISPAGTAYIQERSKVHYPDEDTLINFSEEHGIDIKITKKPYKSKVKEFVESGGQPPEGYTVTQEKSLVIRS